MSLKLYLLNFFSGKYTPVVLLVFSAGPVNISWAENNSMVAAIFQCFFPAQATGEALFTIMTYNSMNPAGRLPYTWYKYADQVNMGVLCQIKDINCPVVSDQRYPLSPVQLC